MTMEEMWNMRASSTMSSAQPGFPASNQFNMDAGQLPQAYMAKEVCVIERTFRQEPMEGFYPDRLRSELLGMASESQQHLARSSPYDASFCPASYGGWPMPSPFTLSQSNGSGKPSDVQGRGFRSQDSFPVNGSRAAQELRLEGSWHFPSSQWQRQQKSTLNSGVSSSGLMSHAQSGGLRVYCINYFGVPVVGQLGLSDAGRLGVTCTCHGQHMSVANFTQHSGLNAANPGEVVYMEGGETLVQWRKSFFSQYGVKVPEDSVGWEWLDFGAAEAGKYVTQSLQKEVNPYDPLSTGMGLKEEVLKSFRGASMATELGSLMSSQYESLSRGTFQSMSHSSDHLSINNGHHLRNDGGQRYSWAGQLPRSGIHAASRLSEGQEPRVRETDNASGFQPTHAAGASMTTSLSVEHPKSFLFEQIMNKVWDGKLQHNVQQFNLPKVSGISDHCGRTNRVDSSGVEDERRSGYQSSSHSSQAAHQPESEFQGKLDSFHQSSRSEDCQLQSEQMAAKLENRMTLDSLSAEALAHLSNKARQRLLETVLQSAFSYRVLGLQDPSSRLSVEDLSGNLDAYASFPGFMVREQGQKQDPNHAFQMRGPRTPFLQQQQHPVEDISGGEPQWRNYSIIDRNGREELQGKVNDNQGRGFEAEGMVKAGLELKVHDAVISRMQALVDRESIEGRTVRGVDQEAITAQVGAEVVPLSTGGDIMQCSCLKCRKASPQAAPRPAVQACLNEKAGLSSSVEAAKKVAGRDGEHVSVESGAHIEQPDTLAAVEMEGVESRKRNVETLACEGMEAAEECDEAIPKYEDTTVRGEAIDVCSNNSENVSSGLSDEGCAVSGDGGSGMVQGSGIIRDAGVVDEGSGIGKCWSSDDVEGNPNTLEDPSKAVGSPPSSSNMGKRLAVKRRGKRASKTIEDEAEPVASTGKLERKQRRNMKWKWLGPGAEGGFAKEGSSASSFGQVAETQVTSEDARIGSKAQERLDALKQDIRVFNGEMIAPSKRRKLLIYKEVKATNVTEENLEAANLDLKRKAGTLVIRVPHWPKAKNGIRTKLWRSSPDEDGVPGEGDGTRAPEARKLIPPRPVGRPTKACASGSGLVRATVGSGPSFVRAVSSGPSFVTKNIRSLRTPLPGLSPRNGRMVSLSAILNQPVEARAVEGRQKLRDGVARLRTADASVFEFIEDEGVAVSRASAGVQTDRPKCCPFPRGERSARPVKRSSAFGEIGKRSVDAGTYECQVSQVRSAAGSSISKEKLQQGFSFPLTKQVRSSKMKRIDVSQEKAGRFPIERVRVGEFGAMKQVHVKAGVGLLKRKPDLCMAGMSAKRPRVVLAVKKVKEIVECEIGESAELFKSSSRGLKTKTVVEDSLGSGTKNRKREKSQMLDANCRWRKERVGIQGNNKLGPSDKRKCDVCGTFSSASYNKLLCCCRCPVKVHQACYGVPKVPKGPWMCRICKFKVFNPICVLCGYGGGAMTRVQKARPFCLALLQIWRDLKNENARETHSDNDDNETLLSATNNIRMKSTGTHTKMKEREPRDGEDHRDDNSSVCKVCRKETPEPGSTSGGNAAANNEDWRRHNTVGSIVKDVGAKQWAHMVCTLWMPGTRCLNMGTMGMFDVSGVTASRRKALCSICQRKGGACIQCRVPKCSTPFHVWCAHEKGLLQSETVQDGSNQVGFFGKCQSHGICSSSEAEDGMKEGGACSSGGGVCARTKGYKGRLSLEERATAQQQMTLEGGTAVTPEQVAAWLRISNRKMTARRGVLKSANPGLKFDHREYLRFKQRKGWRKLAVYKSGIHALGLYTSDFIGEGEVVVEYVGEIVGLRVADKREAEYHSGKRLQHQGACYLFRIDADQIIDATRKGGIARFVNHSCSPNCVAKVICVDNLKKVIFFAKRHIYAGEEVTYDYKFNYDELDEKIPCFCGTPECRGTLN